VLSLWSGRKAPSILNPEVLSTVSHMLSRAVGVSDELFSRVSSTISIPSSPSSSAPKHVSYDHCWASLTSLFFWTSILELTVIHSLIGSTSRTLFPLIQPTYTSGSLSTFLALVVQGQDLGIPPNQQDGFHAFPRTTQDAVCHLPHWSMPVHIHLHHPTVDRIQGSIQACRFRLQSQFWKT